MSNFIVFLDHKMSFAIGFPIGAVDRVQWAEQSSGQLDGGAALRAARGGSHGRGWHGERPRLQPDYPFRLHCDRSRPMATRQFHRKGRAEFQGV